MGAGPASRSAGLKSASPINPRDVPGLSAFTPTRGTATEKDSLGQGISPGPRHSRGVCFCCICYRCHREKTLYTQVYCQRASPSQRFLVICRVKFRGLSRGPSRLGRAGNGGGQHGPHRERSPSVAGLGRGSQGKSSPTCEGTAGAQVRGRKTLECQGFVEKAYKIAGSNERREE